MKKLLYIPILLTSTAYGVVDRSMSPEDQAELKSITAALATCMATKKELDPQRVGSMNLVPNHFKMRKDPNSNDFIPSSILNHSCELLAQRFTEITLHAYGPMRHSSRPHHIDGGI